MEMKTKKFKRDRKGVVKLQFNIASVGTAGLAIVCFCWILFGRQIAEIGEFDNTWIILGLFSLIFFPLLFWILQFALLSFSLDSILKIFRKKSATIVISSLVGFALVISFVSPPFDAIYQIDARVLGSIVFVMFAAKVVNDIRLLASMYKKVATMTQSDVDAIIQIEPYADSDIHAENVDKVLKRSNWAWFVYLVIVVQNIISLFASIIVQNIIGIGVYFAWDAELILTTKLVIGIPLFALWSLFELKRYKLFFVQETRAKKTMWTHYIILAGILIAYFIDYAVAKNSNVATSITHLYMVFFFAIPYLVVNAKIGTKCKRICERRVDALYDTWNKDDEETNFGDEYWNVKNETEHTV